METKQGGACPGSTGIDDDLDALSADMDVIHELSVRGACEWAIMRAATEKLSARAGRMLGVAIARFGDADISLRFRIAGLTTADARCIAQELAKSDSIAFARIEHMILKAKE